MKINWKARFKHKPFLVALFAAVLLLVQVVIEPFGIDFTFYKEWVTNVFNAALAVLVILGIVIDPTTSGTTDSEQALGYNKPRDDLDGE